MSFDGADGQYSFDLTTSMRFIVVVFTLWSAVSVAAIYNAFDRLYAGTRNNYNGRVGYIFQAQQTFKIEALGRSVNNSYNGGILQAGHTIELFKISNGSLIASVVVNGSSPKDRLGYAYKMLASPVTVSSGQQYMILSDETAGDGDRWLDAAAVTGYRNDLVTVLGAQYWGNHAGNPMPTPYYAFGANYLYVPPTFYTSIPDPTPPVLEYQDFSFTSSFDGTNPLWARAVFPGDASNLPLMVIQHGYGSTRDAVMYSAERMAQHGYFCLAVDYRGWDGSAGAHDDGGIEIMDIYDAIEQARIRYHNEINPQLTSIIGYSNGGGNVFFSSVRFPFTFRASMALFGVVDYGQWTTLVSNWRDSVYAAVGGTPAQLPDKYFVRRSEEAALNLSGSHFHIAYDEAEWMCPPIMDEEFVAAVPVEKRGHVFVHVSRTTDADRWTHSHNTSGHLNAIEDLFMADISNNNLQAPVMPDDGTLVVLGFIVTPKFRCFLGSGDNAAAKVEYHFNGDYAAFDFTRLTSDAAITGTIRLDPNVADHDVQVCIDGTGSLIIPQGRNLEFTVGIESSVKVRPYTSSDISGNCEIGMEDIALLAQQWLNICNLDNNWCQRSDVNKSDRVELEDFSKVAGDWLQ